MTHIDNFEGWPIKIFATCINSSAPLYNAWAHCLCNADGSAGSYTDLTRCGADCGCKKGPVSVQAQGSTLAEALERIKGKYPRLMAKLHPLLRASIRDTGKLLAAFEVYCKDGRLSAKAQSFLRSRLIPMIGNERISDITPASLYSTVQTITVEDDARHVTKEEINRHIRYIEQLFELLMQDNCYTTDNDPAVDLAQLKRYTRKSRAAGTNRNRTRLTDEERERLMLWCETHPGRVAAAVALLYNGLSAPELSALDVADVETLPGGIRCVWITRRMLCSGEKYSAQPVAVSQIRRLPLLRTTESALSAADSTLRTPPAKRPLVGMGPDGGRRYTPAAIRKDLAAVLNDLGIYPDAVCSSESSIRPEQAESLLSHDAEFCLSDRMRIPAEYCAMLCGRPQPSTNGRHYIDLDCDDTQTAVYRMAQRCAPVASSGRLPAKDMLSAQRPVCTVFSGAGEFLGAALHPDRPCRVEIASPCGFAVFLKE